MAAIHVLVLRTAGTNCDLETVHAWQIAGAASVERMHIRRVLDEPALLRQFEILTLPGGFSYGDDIAAGRVFAAQIERHLLEELARFVDAGKLILGICNGFQVLVRTGLLPGGPHAATAIIRDRSTQLCTIAENEPPGFQDRWVTLEAGTATNCVFLEPGRTYEMPIAHGEGRVTFTSPAACDAVLKSGLGAVRYVAPGGTGVSPGGTGVSPVLSEPQASARATGMQSASDSGSGSPDSAAAAASILDPPANPNGSDADLAGLCDPTGRVFGLMPHPERFIDWTQHPSWTRNPQRERGDGLAIFERAIAALS